jgi:nucleotide-binding universal stress UspA family protein
MKILFATDGSAEATAASRFLQLLPLPPGSTIRIVAVADDYVRGGEYVFRTTNERLFERVQQAAEGAAQEAAALSEREGLSLTSVVPSGNPSQEILRAAAEFEADLVVVGSKGLTGLEGLFIGSVARAVAHRAGCPVLVARAPRNNLREVIAATDGSESAIRAVQFVGRLPLPEATEITLVHVVRPFQLAFQPYIADPMGLATTLTEVQQIQHESGVSLLAAAQDQFANGGRSPRVELREGDPTTEILRVVEERDADLVVAGARGISWIEGLILGSVADRLLKEARCSVLIVHEPHLPPDRANRR